MSDMTDKGWDEMAAIWQAQPVPDVRKIAAQVQNQHRRLIRRQRHGIIGTIVMAAIAWAMFYMEPDAWFRAWFLVLAGYAILQQYLIVRSARGLFRKHDTESVKDMLGHLARYHRQRIYRSRLRLLETVVIAAATIPLVWHLTGGRWDALFSNFDAGSLSILISVGTIFNLWFAHRGMPRFRRELREAERLRQTLADDEENEQST